MRSLYVYLAGVFICNSAVAGNCDWAKVAPADDETYKYFVSIKHSTKSIADAETKVEQDVNAQLCDQLGNYVSSASDFYESGDVDASGGTSAVKTRCIGIRKQDFARVRYDSGKTDGEYFACVKYKYPKQNLIKEKQRIESEGFATGSAALNEYVGDTECPGMPLSITTTPAGALVSIDDKKEYFGRTPLRFGNVCKGKHNIKITMDDYEDVVESIDNQTSFHRNLNRDKKTVKISTNVGKSTIVVSDTDGFERGRGSEPYSFDFLSGIPYTITVQSDAAKTISQEYTFNKYSDSNLLLNLNKLPAALDFTVFQQRNPDVDIFVNGDAVSGASVYNLNSDSTQEITFKKKDFVDINRTVRIDPGETYHYPSTELEFSKDNSAWAQKRLGFDIKLLGGGIFSNAGNGYNYGLEIGMFKRLWSNVGLRGALGWQHFEITDENPLLEFDKSTSQFVHVSNTERPDLCPGGQSCEKVYFWGSAYNYDYGYFDTPETAHVSINAKSKYSEPFYFNAGFMFGKHLYVYGAGALGYYTSVAESISESVYDFQHQPYDIMTIQSSDKDMVLRFGGGLQWTFNTSDLQYGIRMQYLTSGNLSDSKYQYQIIESGNVNSNPDYAYKYNIKNIALPNSVKNIQSFNVSVFIGF